MILDTKFGSLWTISWPDKISIFLKIEKAKKSIFPIEIRSFFLWKLGGPFFLSQSLPNLRILHTKFGLIWTAAWTDKKDLFLIFLIEKIAIFRTKNIFFLGKLHKKLFLLHTSIIQVILHTKFGSLWTTRPDKISFILEIEKSENVDISDWNTNIFYMKTRRTILFVSESPYPEDTP